MTTKAKTPKTPKAKTPKAKTLKTVKEDTPKKPEKITHRMVCGFDIEGRQGMSEAVKKTLFVDMVKKANQYAKQDSWPSDSVFVDTGKTASKETLIDFFRVVIDVLTVYVIEEVKIQGDKLLESIVEYVDTLPENLPVVSQGNQRNGGLILLECRGIKHGHKPILVASNGHKASIFDNDLFSATHKLGRLASLEQAIKDYQSGVCTETAFRKKHNFPVGKLRTESLRHFCGAKVVCVYGANPETVASWTKYDTAQGILNADNPTAALQLVLTGEQEKDTKCMPKKLILELAEMSGNDIFRDIAEGRILEAQQKAVAMKTETEVITETPKA